MSQQRYLLKGTFTGKNGKKFVRYWCNGEGLTGWVFPEVKARANRYTRSAGQKMIDSPRRNPKVVYELEPVA